MADHCFVARSSRMLPSEVVKSTLSRFTVSLWGRIVWCLHPAQLTVPRLLPDEQPLSYRCRDHQWPLERRYAPAQWRLHPSQSPVK